MIEMKRKLWATLAVLAVFVLSLTATACSNPAGRPLEPASISLNVTETHSFDSVYADYGEIEPITVTVTNIGGEATGELTVELSGDNEDSFTVYPATLPGIPAGGSATFTVGPNLGLPVGTYTAMVTVSGGAGITSRSFDVSFEVVGDLAFGISLSAAATETFGPFQVGYPEIAPRPITITNIGTQPTGELTVGLSGDNPGFFTVYPVTIASILVDGTATFTIGPNHDLPVGTHTATVTVSGGESITSQSFIVSFQVTEDAPDPTFGISLNVATAHDFGYAQYGYDAIPQLTVTINNTGNQPTGALTVGLSGDNPDFFTVSAISPSDIPVGGTATFTIGPNHDLPVGTHTATVTVSGGESITSQSFNVSFQVTADAPDPTFGISLNVAAVYDFGYAQYGYETIPQLTVTVSNTGNQPTGELTATLSGGNPDSFTASAISPSDIPVDGTATFTIGPNLGLAVGTYTATVTVSGGAGIADQSFDVSFQVTEGAPDPTFGISLSAAATETFGPFQVGYPEITPRPITITNTGNQPTGALTIGLSGDNPDFFTASAISPSDIPVGGTATFTIGPNHDLPVGTHTATVTVSGDESITSQSFDVSFQVTEDTPDPTFGISLNVATAHDFGYAQYGYDAIPRLTVTISNTGNQPTGELTATLSGANHGSFAMSTISPINIPTGGTATFTIGPNNDLPVSTHTATVTVSGGAGITAQSFDVTFRVTPVPIPTFNVVFNTHGGTSVPTQTIQDGQMATRPTPNPERAEHTFIDWFTAETDGTEFDFANTPITANTTIHARWQLVDNYDCEYCNDEGCDVCTPPGYRNFTINFAGFTNPIPGNIIGPDLNLRNNNAAGEIRITGIPAGATVNWFLQNAPITNGTTLADGTATLALNQAIHGGMIGTHAVTVEALVDGRLYSRIITFRVMP